MKTYYTSILISILFVSSCQSVTPTSESESAKNTQMAFAWTTVSQTAWVDPSAITTFTPPADIFRTPIITSTPIIATINTVDEVEILIERLYPLCIGYNDVKSSKWAPSHLEVIETNMEADSKKYWVSEVADNVDKSLQAFVACKPELCHEQIYVKDNKTGKVYEVDWEFRMPQRPIKWITWINNDTLAFYHSFNPSHGTIKVINFTKKKYIFSATVFPDEYCSTSTPNP